MLSIRSLSPELQKIARDELNEDSNTIHSNVQHIRQWAETQKHLRVKTDEQYIVTHLRCCKYDLELAKQKMEMMCTMRTDLPQLFSNRDPFLPEMQELLRQGVCLPLLKTKSPESSRVILVRNGDADFFKIKLVNVFKYLFMIGDIILNEDDNFIVGGGQAIGDCSTGTVQHLKLLDLGLIKSIYKLYNEAYAVIPKGAIGIAVPKFVEVMYDTFKYILKSEHRQLIHMYHSSNPPQLSEIAPLSMLPIDYGGRDGTVEELTAYWKHKIESYRDWFVEEEQYRLDKTQLPEKEAKKGWFGNKSSS